MCQPAELHWSPSWDDCE